MMNVDLLPSSYVRPAESLRSTYAVTPQKSHDSQPPPSPSDRFIRLPRPPQPSPTPIISPLPHSIDKSPSNFPDQHPADAPKHSHHPDYHHHDVSRYHTMLYRSQNEDSTTRRVRLNNVQIAYLQLAWRKVKSYPVCENHIWM